MAGVVEALGLIADMESVPLAIEGGATVTLHPLGPAEMMPPDTDMTWSRRADWIDARGESHPLWLQDAKSPARMEVLPGKKTRYVQLNQISDQLPKFADAMRQKIESEG